jgi:hypothetical protein
VNNNVYIVKFLVQNLLPMLRVDRLPQSRGFDEVVVVLGGVAGEFTEAVGPFQLFPNKADTFVFVEHKRIELLADALIFILKALTYQKTWKCDEQLRVPTFDLFLE